MAKETKEQKEARWAEEERIREVAKAEFRKTMPARLKLMQESAFDSGVNTRIFLTDTGPAVEFTRYNSEVGYNGFEQTLTYDSAADEVEYVERKITAFKEEIEASRRRRELAQTLWKNLSDDEKEGLKENLDILAKYEQKTNR